MVCGRFTRQHRLLTPKDFNYVFAKPVKQGDKHLTLLARSNKIIDGRLGLIVPKRESFRCHQTQLQGLDVVVLVRGGFALMNNKTIISLLDKHWNSLSKKCANSSSS